MNDHQAQPELARSTLKIDEAVRLSHALVQFVAEEQPAVRVIFIKGPVSTEQGLREQRTSADTDLLVEFDSLQVLIDRLAKRGWLKRQADPDEIAFPPHSITLYHPEWPCDIDIHFRFPGMEAAPQESFEIMWKHSQDWKVAGRRLRVPSLPLAICILALHSLRTPWSVQHQGVLDRLRDSVHRSMQETILEIAQDTKSLAALRPYLVRVFEAPFVEDWGTASMEWHMRTTARTPASARVMSVLFGPWRNKPRALAAALSVSKETRQVESIYSEVSFTARQKAQVFRVLRFVKHFREVWTDVNIFVEAWLEINRRRS